MVHVDQCWIAKGSLLQSLSSRFFPAIAVCCPRHGWYVSPLQSGILVQWQLTGGALVASWVFTQMFMDVYGSFGRAQHKQTPHFKASSGLLSMIPCFHTALEVCDSPCPK